MNRGRYFQPRDIRLVRSINSELINNVIQTSVVLYKISPNETSTNIYGETSTKNKKTYFRGVKINCLVDRGELTTKPDDFIDKKQNTVFKFLYHELQKLGYYLQEGDIIDFNSRLHQIDNVVGQDQLLGGQPNKSFSIIVNTHYSRLSINDLHFEPTKYEKPIVTNALPIAPLPVITNPIFYDNDNGNYYTLQLSGLDGLEHINIISTSPASVSDFSITDLNNSNSYTLSIKGLVDNEFLHISENLSGPLSTLKLYNPDNSSYYIINIKGEVNSEYIQFTKT